MTSSTFMDKWWSLPLVIALEVLLSIGAVWLLLHLSVSAPFYQALRAPEQKAQINSFSVPTASGAIQVIDLKSGTEFNRLLLFPDGRIVAESGWINHWGEQQIRIIGGRVADP